MMNFAIGEIPGMVATSPIWRSVRWRLGTARDAASRLLGTSEQHWARVVMDIETNAPVSRMAVQSLAALEISGAKWADRGFASDRSAQFPEFDICGEPLGETFDLIIAEQVLEHVLWPYRAVRNLWCMLKPGGVAILTASFLLHLHDDPVDCSRWTETGLRHLLAEWGFGLEERQPTWDSHRLSSNSWCRPVATGSNSAGR